MTALHKAMAALERWQLQDDDLLRDFKVSFVGHSVDSERPWKVYLTICGEQDDQDAFEDVSGRTMADALASAAQVVTSNPELKP